MISGPPAGLRNFRYCKNYTEHLKDIYRTQRETTLFFGFGWPLHLFYQRSSSSCSNSWGPNLTWFLWQLILFKVIPKLILHEENRRTLSGWCTVLICIKPVWAASISESIGSPIIFRLTQQNHTNYTIESRPLKCASVCRKWLAPSTCQ